MFIELKNGSTWQCIGSDRYDATVGAGPVFIAYSEWALANPSAWAYHRPMLEENGGGAAFITTPRGRNHAKAMFDRYSKVAATNPRYFAEMSSVVETGALTAAQLEEALAEYCDLYGEDLGRAQYEQEYLCSFNAAILRLPSGICHWRGKTPGPRGPRSPPRSTPCRTDTFWPPRCRAGDDNARPAVLRRHAQAGR